MLYNYIWGSKTDRISRNQITKDYKEGGCRMVHIDIFIKSLKIPGSDEFFIQMHHGKHYSLPCIKLIRRN